MEIPDQWVGALLVSLIILVLGQFLMSYRAFYQHKEEVRNLMDAKTENIAKSIENWNIKNENCSIRIDTANARLESFESKQDQANKEIWTRMDQVERRLQDRLSHLKEDILVLQTTSEMLKKAGLRESEDTYKKQGGDM
ncbi:hypothetical protein [Methanoculleus sp.]|uniref:hypothetical protein n=1 Tax=Methanoculleus sp. TaxID=90427 RepID=UPI002FC9B21C